MINPAMIKKGVEVAGKVVQASEMINTASKAAGINQDSIFAQNEKEGKGGALNSVFQAADTVTNGQVGKVMETVDGVTNGAASNVTQTADKIATPVLNAVGGAGEGTEEELLKKLGKKPTLGEQGIEA